MKEIKKIDAENCCVKIVGYKFTENRGYYGADVELDCQLIDEETEKLIDEFIYCTKEAGFTDESGEQWYGLLGEYFDKNFEACEDDFEELDEKYNNLSREKKDEFNEKYEEYCLNLLNDAYDMDYFDTEENRTEALEAYIDELDYKYYVFEKNKFILFTEVEADFNDAGLKVLEGDGLTGVFNLNQEAFIQKYKNTYFTVEYGGRIQYYKRKNCKIDYLAIGEDWGFYATKDNCGYFVETEI